VIWEDPEWPGMPLWGFSRSPGTNKIGQGGGSAVGMRYLGGRTNRA
jgi:hypothetical protein